MGVKKQSTRFTQANLRQIEGRNPVMEAMRAKSAVTSIMIEENIAIDDRLGEIMHRARKAGVKVERVTSDKLRKYSKTGGHHQGVIAYAEYPDEPKVEQMIKLIRQYGEEPFFMVLPEVLYEHNLGAVLRSAEAAGVHAVITSNRGHQLTPVVSKTAVGAGEHIPLVHENIFMVLKLFKKEGIRIYGMTEGDENQRIYNTDMTGGLAIVMGAEDTGISDVVFKLVDRVISIPMLGKIESLNMSVAAAVCMYEVVRQRKYAK